MVTLLLACGAGPTVASTPPRDAELCPPFAGWSLPVGDGRVVHCDERRLQLHYDAGRADALAPAFRLAIRAAGWVEDIDSSAAGLINVRYRLDGASLDLSVVDDAARSSLVLTVVP